MSLLHWSLDRCLAKQIVPHHAWSHPVMMRLPAGLESATDLLLLRNQLPWLEALAHCVQHDLPALLVGTAATGKTSMVQALAALCGQPLVQIALNGSSDTSDLLGGFEQASMGHRLQVCLFSSMDGCLHTQHLMPQTPGIASQPCLWCHMIWRGVIESAGWLWRVSFSLTVNALMHNQPSASARQ